jgi:Putative adhesin
MNHHTAVHKQKLATWMGAILGTFCALSVGQAHASEHVYDRAGMLKEEFHETYPLSSNGRIELDNINGAAHITAWDRNEVKVDAIKYARSQERLNEAKIVVNAENNYLAIRTEYPDHDHTFSDDDRDNPASVEYALMVPRAANLDEIKLINGPLDIQNVNGEVRASCINGKLSASGLSNRVKLSTINGRLDIRMNTLPASDVELSSVNGGLELTLPSDAKAELEASTVHGGIDSDFGLHVNHHRWVGHELRGELGGGGTHIRLSNVNGRIEIRHASDGRPMSPAKDLNRPENDDDEI